MSAKIAVSSSITWLIGWMRPRVSGPSRTGSVTSRRSAARRAVEGGLGERLASRVAIAPWTLSRRPLMSGPLRLALLRASCAPSVFRSSETAPFLPSAETRTASSAASSGGGVDLAEQVAFECCEIGHRSSEHWMRRFGAARTRTVKRFRAAATAAAAVSGRTAGRRTRRAGSCGRAGERRSGQAAALLPAAAALARST